MEEEKKYISPRVGGLISILSGQFGKESRIIGPENVDRLSLGTRSFAVDVHLNGIYHVSIIVIRLYSGGGEVSVAFSFDGRPPGADNRVEPGSVEMWNRNRRKRGKFSVQKTVQTTDPSRLASFRIPGRNRVARSGRVSRGAR